MEWRKIKQSYKLGQPVLANIHQIDHYGIHSFVQNAKAYTKRSECLLTRKMVDLKHEFQVGQEQPARVIGFNDKHESLELSFRQAMDNPWPAFREQVEIGTFIEGEVVVLTESKALVELRPGIAGVLHAHDMWIKAEHIDDVLKVQDRVRLQVIGVSEKDELLLLGARGLFQDEDNSTDTQATFKIEEKLTDALQIFKWEQTRQTRRKYVLSRDFQSRFKEIQVIDTDEIVSQPLIQMLSSGFGIKARLVFPESLKAQPQSDFMLNVVSCQVKKNELLPSLVQRLYPKTPQLVYGTLETWEACKTDLQQLAVPNQFLKIPHSSEDLIHALNAMIDDGQMAKDISLKAAAEKPNPGNEEKSPDKSITGLMHEIKTLTKASFVVIFQLQLNSMETDIYASTGKSLQLSKFDRSHLQFSPISDVIVDGDYVVENHGCFHFKYMKALGHFESLIGIKIQYSDEHGYGLFLFGDRAFQFDKLKEQSVNFCELAVRSYIERNLFIERTSDDQKFIVTGKMTANFMHEIKNQIQALDYWLEILKNDSIQLNAGKLMGDDKLFLSRFEQSINGARSTQLGILDIEELFLNLLRQEDKTKINLETVLKKFVETLLPIARRKKIKVQASAPRNLHVTTSVSSLNQILINLFLNSIDFMPLVRRQTGRIEIKAERFPEDDLPIHIEFIDNGPGINECFREKVFETLYTTKSNGSGLGLAISRRLAQDLGGQLSIKETQRLNGVTFLLALPQ